MQLQNVAWVTMTHSPTRAHFGDETFIQAGRLGVLVGYFNGLVGVYRTNPLTAKFENLVAVDTTPRRRYAGWQQKYSANSRAAAVAKKALEEGRLLPSSKVQLPKLYVAMTKVPDPSDVCQKSLEKLAGSSDGARLMETFYRVLRRFGEFCMVPYPLVENPQEDMVYESVEGLIGRDGYAVPQAIYQDCLKRFGLHQSNLMKPKRPKATP